MEQDAQRSVRMIEARTWQGDDFTICYLASSLSKTDIGYSPDDLVKKLPTLCRKGEQDNGFFRSLQEILCGEKSLWLVLPSSSVRLPGLAEDAVKWFEGDWQIYPIR